MKWTVSWKIQSTKTNRSIYVLNRYTSVKVAESIRNNLPKQNATGPDLLTGEI